MSASATAVSTGKGHCGKTVHHSVPFCRAVSSDGLCGHAESGRTLTKTISCCHKLPGVSAQNAQFYSKSEDADVETMATGLRALHSKRRSVTQQTSARYTANDDSFANITLLANPVPLDAPTYSCACTPNNEDAQLLRPGPLFFHKSTNNAQKTRSQLPAGKGEDQPPLVNSPQRL